MKVYKVKVFSGDELIWVAFLSSSNMHEILTVTLPSVILEYGIGQTKEIRIVTEEL